MAVEYNAVNALIGRSANPLHRFANSQRLLSAIALLAASSLRASDRPKLPYSDPGACPFECCVYQAWRARVRQPAYAVPQAAARVAFTVHPGETVQAITGVVITRKAGIVIVRKTTAFEDITVPAGAKVYVLHRTGEGEALFWYRGAAHLGELYAESVHRGNARYPFDVLSLPQTEWWVKVSSQKGAIGWLLNPRGFHGMDACGN